MTVRDCRLAKEIGVPARRVNEIVHGQRRISADTALRLARFFGTSGDSGSTCSRATTWRWKRTVGGGRDWSLTAAHVQLPAQFPAVA